MLDALEAEYPMLKGTLRDHVTQQRRKFVRFFAEEEDLSHEALDAALPDSVVAGTEPFIVVGAVLCLIVARSLNVTALGDDLAKSMGGNVARTQAVSLVAVTLMAGAATAGAGPIGFVGLTIPHVARMIVGPDYRWVLPYSMVLAPILLLAADILGRVVARPGELQVAIVTAFLGAPVFIALVRRKKLAEL